MPTNLNQLWVADITYYYIAIATGFVYLAAILDAWSRRVVGYAIGKRIDARLALAALRAAIAARRPSPGCIHHSDRGSQLPKITVPSLTSTTSRARWVDAAIHTTMTRRKASRKLKVEEVEMMEYETLDDVAASLPRLMKGPKMRRSPLGARIQKSSQVRTETPGRWPIQQPGSIPVPKGSLMGL